MNDHIGDDVELYALDLLDEADRERADAHLVTCGACSRSVGEAERVSLALFNLPEVTATRPKPSLQWLAVAATFALAIGLGATLVREHARLDTLRSDDDVAFATIATSHFLHASFVPAQPTAFPAKVLYGRDTDWLYVIVDAPVENWRITGKTPTGLTERIATLHPHGETAVAFARPREKLDRLQLLDTSGQTIATVKLTYPSARANP